MSDEEPVKLGDPVTLESTDTSDNASDEQPHEVPAEPVEETSAGSAGEIAEIGTVQVDAPTNSGFVNKDTELLNPDDSESLAHLGEPEEVEIGYTYVSHLDPNRQRDPNGTYLDDIERRNAEVIRARAEDREPDLDNPPAVCSTPLIPSVQAQHLAPTGAVVPVSSLETVSVGGETHDTNAAVEEDDE